MSSTGDPMVRMLLCSVMSKLSNDGFGVFWSILAVFFSLQLVLYVGADLLEWNERRRVK